MFNYITLLESYSTERE